MSYDYLEAVKDEDSVTGNTSENYTFSTYKAENNFCHNMDLLGAVLQEFGCGTNYLIDNGEEACDVIRKGNESNE